MQNAINKEFAESGTFGALGITQDQFKKYSTAEAAFIGLGIDNSQKEVFTAAFDNWKTATDQIKASQETINEYTENTIELYTTAYLGVLEQVGKELNTQMGYYKTMNEL
jgi:hypothetical protein